MLYYHNQRLANMSTPPSSSTAATATPTAPETSNAFPSSFDPEEFKTYLQYKVPSSIIVGGLSGGAWGYYVGDVAALYSCTYAFGFGFASTAFFCGTYGLRKLRQQDDVYNYALSGAFNSAWMVTGLAGKRRGALAGLLGAASGAALKISGDWFYDTGRQAWITHRRVTLDESRPRLLSTTQRKTPPEGTPTTTIPIGSGGPNLSRSRSVPVREELYLFGRPAETKAAESSAPSTPSTPTSK